MGDLENIPNRRPNARYEHAFAIVRLDPYPNVDTEVESGTAITVTKVVREQEIAEAEVERLNGLNGPKGASYLWTITRLEPRLAERK